eukprot:scaffold85080_cov31-Tisochrysis_lutea.AAC.14
MLRATAWDETKRTFNEPFLRIFGCVIGWGGLEWLCKKNFFKKPANPAILPPYTGDPGIPDNGPCPTPSLTHAFPLSLSSLSSVSKGRSVCNTLDLA